MKKETVFVTLDEPKFQPPTRKEKIFYAIWLAILGLLASSFTDPGAGPYQSTRLDGTCIIWSVDQVFEVGCTCEIREYQTGNLAIYTDELGNPLKEVLIFQP